MKQERYFVAVKGPRVGGRVTQGKALGDYREEGFARRDLAKLADRAGYKNDPGKVGVFYKGELVK